MGAKVGKPGGGVGTMAGIWVGFRLASGKRGGGNECEEGLCDNLDVGS